MVNCNCEGCNIEFETACEFYNLGYDVGFNWYEGHCFFFALDKETGEWVAG